MTINKLLRVFMALLAVIVLFATASANAAKTEILLARDTVTDCTYNCWWESQRESGCSASTDNQTACMCNSLENYERFHGCVVSLCYYLGEFDGLTPAMECVGYRRLAARTTRGSGILYADQTTSAWWLKESTLSATASTLNFNPDGPKAGKTFSADLPVLAPTTLKTVYKRDAQIAALSPYQTEPPSPPPKPHSQVPWQSQQITHHTVGPCGVVAGMACPGKFFDTPATKEPESILTSTLYVTTAVATTTASAPVLVPRSTLPSHSGGLINFCGVPGSACSDKEINNAEDAPPAITTTTTTVTTYPYSTAVFKVHPPDSTPFVSSLVRMCEKPDLIDCLIPLAPGPAISAIQSAGHPALPTTFRRTLSHTNPVTINCQDAQCGGGTDVKPWRTMNMLLRDE
ncbi:hypothetical protein LTR78_005750 [Recurvomyces mirabilis]|uniref:Extracellular membrane protein CFEM domain-containing protein n=1 Tax=Recurvomyces mirabilis TaxID=574656 RepID=A0AAE0WMB0_9PEZI|nr:hypothetical protein LTR78_005750 [Recurvomyces mirabilis]KAK5154129.1 hypothetical protein LTS14_006814 [Recurvomyces mirabilis]